MANKRKIWSLIFGIGWVLGCTPSSLGISAYLKYLANPKHGLVQTKTVGDIAIQVKYLPAEYQVYQELAFDRQEISPVVWDSLLALYREGHAFMLTIGPAPGSKFDIAQVGVRDYDEYSARVEQLNFGLKEQVYLEAGGKRIAPALLQMENVYGLKKSRNFLFSFPSEDILQGDVYFVYNDDIFYTGINKLLFRKQDLNAIPTLNYAL